MCGKQSGGLKKPIWYNIYVKDRNIIVFVIKIKKVY